MANIEYSEERHLDLKSIHLNKPGVLHSGSDNCEQVEKNSSDNTEYNSAADSQCSNSSQTVQNDSKDIAFVIGGVIDSKGKEVKLHGEKEIDIQKEKNYHFIRSEQCKEPHSSSPVISAANITQPLSDQFLHHDDDENESVMIGVLTYRHSNPNKDDDSVKLLPVFVENEDFDCTENPTNNTGSPSTSVTVSHSHAESNSKDSSDIHVESKHSYSLHNLDIQNNTEDRGPGIYNEIGVELHVKDNHIEIFAKYWDIMKITESLIKIWEEHREMLNYASTYNGVGVKHKEMDAYKPTLSFKKVGQGSFGKVLKVIFVHETCPCLKKDIAVKVFYGKGKEEKLNEPINLIALSDEEWFPKWFGTMYISDVIFMAMEFEELTLEQYVKQFEDKLPKEKIVAISKNLLSAAEALQKYCINHGDIKPNNIIVNKNGQKLKVIDFGTSSRFDDKKFHFKGRTLYYCPPEVCRNPCEVFQESDIPSVALVMAFLHTKRHLWVEILQKRNKVLPKRLVIGEDTDINEKKSIKMSYWRKVNDSKALVADNYDLASQEVSNLQTSGMLDKDMCSLLKHMLCAIPKNRLSPTICREILCEMQNNEGNQSVRTDTQCAASGYRRKRPVANEFSAGHEDETKVQDIQPAARRKMFAEERDSVTFNQQLIGQHQPISQQHFSENITIVPGVSVMPKLQPTVAPMQTVLPHFEKILGTSSEDQLSNDAVMDDLTKPGSLTPQPNSEINKDSLTSGYVTLPGH